MNTRVTNLEAGDRITARAHHAHDVHVEGVVAFRQTGRCFVLVRKANGSRVRLAFHLADYVTRHNAR